MDDRTQFISNRFRWADAAPALTGDMVNGQNFMIFERDYHNGCIYSNFKYTENANNLVAQYLLLKTKLLTVKLGRKIELKMGRV